MKLYHITLNNLRRRKAKMFFVLLGLVIGIATIVSVYGVVEAMKTEMTRQVTEFGVNVVITPDAGGLAFSYGGITLPEIMYDVEQLTNEDVKALKELPSTDMIRVMAPKVMGVVHHSKHKLMVVGANIQEEFLVKPWLRIADPNLVEAPKAEGEAAEETKEEEKSNQEGTATVGEKKMDFEAIDLARQNLENLVLRDDQVILGKSLANLLKMKEGDTFTLGGKEVEVYGVLMESGTAEDQQLIMNLGAAQELLDRPEEVTIIEMAVDYFRGSEEALLAEIKEALPHAQVTSLRQETLRRDEMLMRLVRFGMSISVLVILVGMLVVALTMSGAVRERTREIGVFRALGFRKSHISQMIITEGVIISIIGGIIGYILGIYIAQYGGPIFAGMDIEVPWSIGLLIMAIGLSVVIGVISSLYPAYQASKLDPVEALRFI